MKSIIYDTDYMDMELGFAFRFLNNQSILTDKHAHNYYEYFLVTSGNITHIVNDREELLSSGDLVFIRSNDYHQYRIIKNVNCEMINISFTVAHFESACQFLGEEIKRYLLDPPFPPTINLPAFQQSTLIKDHEFLNFYAGDNKTLCVRMKLLLIEVLSIFIKNPVQSEPRSFSEWLELKLKKMNTQENIEEGIPALLRITGFSHGHLCRIMKDYMNTTPTQYVTELRMVYASNLLVNSDMDILSISMRVGYTSLSHFIATFKKKYGIPPSKYRQLYAKISAWK